VGLLSILAVLSAQVSPLTIQGPGAVWCGEENFYSLQSPVPSGDFRWRLEWKASGGSPQSWEGDANQPILNLVFPDDPGPHRLWVLAGDGTISNQLDIEALPLNPREPFEKPLVVSVPPLPAAPTMERSRLTGDPGSLPFRAPVPALPVPVTGPLRSTALPSPANDPAEPGTTGSLPIVILPNEDGILDVAAAGEPVDRDAIPNPFRVRYRPRLQVREVPVTIGLVLVGSNPAGGTAVINGRLYSPGDLLEGMTIAAITADTIELTQGNLLLRLPVQDKPVSLRLLR